jgi:hypothetical protein
LYANLYETWRTTFNRLEHSLKLNRFYSYFEFILSSSQRNRISTIPPRKSKFCYFWVTLMNNFVNKYELNWIEYQNEWNKKMKRMQFFFTNFLFIKPYFFCLAIRKLWNLLKNPLRVVESLKKKLTIILSWSLDDGGDLVRQVVHKC